MAVPTNITSELAALQAQVAAAKPLQSAPFATVKAIQLNAQNLVVDIDVAVANSGTLDTWISPSDPGTIISGVLGLYGNALDQSVLSNMRGYVGRATSNLDQVN